MDNLDIGIMLGMRPRRNKKTVDAINRARGKEITGLTLDDSANGDDGALLFAFDDGSTLNIHDKGRKCCEARYMTTDDDLAYHVGALFVGAETRDAPDVEGGCFDVHEVQFLVIHTTRGQFTVETHNEQNGSYGGFAIVAM